MEETNDDTGEAEQGPPNAWWASDFVEKLGSASLASQEDTLSHKEPIGRSDQDELNSQRASQVFWSTGILSELIPNGFYYVVPDRKLKDMFDRLPTLDELFALEAEGFRVDIILVDARRDKKLSMLKQLTLALVRGLNSNPVAMVKKIAGLVYDLYKRPNTECCAMQASLEEAFQFFGARGAQMLGQIKHGSCCPRAILFKVLADTVGLENKLMVGLPNDGTAEGIDSCKHMSVVVVLNSVELFVDLMRVPGKLIPRSTKTILLTHISVAGESDSADNDSCDSPLEPNSPLCGFSDRVDHDSVEKDETSKFLRKFDMSMNASGASLQNKLLRSATISDRRLSEPNITTEVWRRSRRKVNPEQRTASSSPEHPSILARGLSVLGGNRKCLGSNADEADSSRSVGAQAQSTGARRLRRRSISITPEIGDDIVRAVRAMNETLKQNRLMREGRGDRSLPTSPNAVSDFHLQNRDEISGARSTSYAVHAEKSSQRAMSLPTSPHGYRVHNPESNSEEMFSTWNEIVDAHTFHDKSLLPYAEWNIDFSELTVGTRVGIGFFGEVFRGIWNGTDVAIKVFLEQDLTLENMEDFCNEISILSRLRHPNVILFLGACTKPPRLSMITEYMEMGSLYYLIHMSGQKMKLSWRRRLKMLRDICRFDLLP